MLAHSGLDPEFLYSKFSMVFITVCFFFYYYSLIYHLSASMLYLAVICNTHFSCPRSGHDIFPIHKVIKIILHNVLYPTELYVKVRQGTYDL